MLDKETIFIEKLKNTRVTKGIGDDCINLELSKKNLVLAADSFLEGVHFKKEWMDFKSIAKKAFLVNISDLIVKNAIPKYALLCISLPPYLNLKNMSDITEGIKDICNQYKIKIIGGDTTGGNKLNFNISMIGELNKRFIKRSGIREGDLLAYTHERKSDIGSSLKALNNLLKYNIKIKNTLNKKNTFARFKTPTLRDKFIYKSQALITASMDITDGLNTEITRLQNINKINFKPLNYRDKYRAKYISGEEYEMLFTFSNKNIRHISRIADICRIKVKVIGRFSKFYKKFKAKKIIWH